MKLGNFEYDTFVAGVANLQMNTTGTGLSTTPYGSRATSYTTTGSGGPSPQQQHSRSHNSMATISRCQSPTHSAALSPLLGAPANSNVYHSRLHQTVMVTALSQAQPSPVTSYNSIHLKEIPPSSKPLYPEICLEHVWTESISASK